MVRTFPKRKLKKIDGEYILWHILDHLRFAKTDWDVLVAAESEATIYSLIREHFRT